jgi:D-alanyl-D-alanine carboxypeptidase
MIQTRVALAALVILLAACSMATPQVDDARTFEGPGATSPAPPAPARANGPERIAARTVLDRPPQPAMAVAFRADLVSDYCVDRDLPAPPVDDDDDDDEALVLLDRSYALPAGYAPGDLVSAAASGLGGPSGVKLIRATVVDDLAAMAQAWEDAGLTISIDSAYRSYANQVATFDMWATRLGVAEALERTARPGHSEHQLGTALDLTSPGWSGRFGDWAVESAEGAWMAAHGWEYGFVMSYPAGSRGETCFSYEPWHYRWIGREPAAAHRASGLDLRRFLERYVGA